jgi:hypothetical protein
MIEASFSFLRTVAMPITDVRTVAMPITDVGGPLVFRFSGAHLADRSTAVTTIVQDSVGEKSIGTLASVAIDTRGPRQLAKTESLQFRVMK